MVVCTRTAQRILQVSEARHLCECWWFQIIHTEILHTLALFREPIQELRWIRIAPFVEAQGLEDGARGKTIGRLDEEKLPGYRRWHEIIDDLTFPRAIRGAMREEDRAVRSDVRTPLQQFCLRRHIATEPVRREESRGRVRASAAESRTCMYSLSHMCNKALVTTCAFPELLEGSYDKVPPVERHRPLRRVERIAIQAPIRFSVVELVIDCHLDIIAVVNHLEERCKVVETIIASRRHAQEDINLRRREELQLEREAPNLV